jgi:hypothetical protein
MKLIFVSNNNSEIKQNNIMKTKTILIYLILLISSVSYSQYTQQWVNRYNGPMNSFDEAFSIAVDGSGNVYTAGVSAANNFNLDYAVIKYSSSGAQLWAKRYDGPAGKSDYAKSVAVDASGNVYVSGFSDGNNDLDYLTIKYNSSGTQLWAQRYNGTGDSTDYEYAMAIDGSGNVYVTGSTIRAGINNHYLTVKYSTAGVLQWVQEYNGPGIGDDIAYSIAVDASANVYVTGVSAGNGSQGDYTTIKYNTSGVQQWVSRYNGGANGDDVGISIALDASGNVYVTGGSQGSAANSFDYATVKYNSSGVQQWASRYNGASSDFDWANSIALDGSGNVYVTGQSKGTGSNYHYATVKYNNSGAQQWAQVYNGPGSGEDVASVIKVSSSGNVFVTGKSMGNGTSFDYATIKYNTSGVQQWVARYNGPGGTGNNDDYASSLAIDGSGNVYVTGLSDGIGTGTDYATIKYSQPVGIEPISNEIPKTYSLEQNYPNPFNPVTNIKFQIPNAGFVKLLVYDITGREIAVLANEQLSAGTSKAVFDGTNLASGIYFCRLEAEGFTDVKKMSLVK